jgi:hypothetical protein
MDSFRERPGLLKDLHQTLRVTPCLDAVFVGSDANAYVGQSAPLLA